jgi:hypothetical protein
MRSATLLLATLLFAGCSKPTSTADAPVGACTKAEERCQYAEGKIGLCTPSADCDGSRSCLVCMSLH